MTRTSGQSAEEERPHRLPPQLAGILRPELPSLSDEIITAIRDAIPEYARPMDGPYGQVMRTGVEQALTSFVDLVADPTMSLADRDEVARMLGRHEAEEGRSLDSLQAAYRLGAQVAWHRVMQVGGEASLSSAVMSTLAEAVFGYMDDLARLSFQGYREVKAGSAEEQRAARRRLMQLILNRNDPVPLRALADLAATASWPLPGQITAVALAPGPADDTALAELSADNDVLACLDDPQPHLLLRGGVASSRWAAPESWPDGRRAVIGLTVPLADAADSLRWARQALALAESGTIDAGPLVYCENHLVTLWLLSDSALADQVSLAALRRARGADPAAAGAADRDVRGVAGDAGHGGGDRRPPPGAPADRPLPHPPARTDAGRPVRRSGRTVRHGNGPASHAAPGEETAGGADRGLAAKAAWPRGRRCPHAGWWCTTSVKNQYQ